MVEKDIYFDAKYLLRARNVSLGKKIRPAFTLNIPSKDTDCFNKIITEQPYILSNELKLFPGDNVLLQFAIEEDSIKRFSVVDSITEPKNTVEIDFKINEYGDNLTTELNIKNPFNKQLMCKAYILPLNSETYKSTNIKPIYPGNNSIESWSFPVYSIIISEFDLE